MENKYIRKSLLPLSLLLLLILIVVVVTFILPEYKESSLVYYTVLALGIGILIASFFNIISLFKK